MQNLKRRIDCAAKREKCDLVIKNALVFSVFTGETEEGDIAVADGVVVAIGKGYEGEREYDAKGAAAIPGLIDAHIHVESSLLSPEAFASLAVPHGTTGIVADPHELVNVCGIAGAEYVREAFSRLFLDGINPLDVYLQLPSCVPATPFETSGAVIDGRETERELGRDLFFGLGEMMNYPAVVGADADVLRKLTAAKELDKVIDGHAPALTGEDLNGYLAAGIRTDHECISAEECMQKLARGMYIQLRNGSSAHNIDVNYKAMNAFNFRRFILCSDDKNAPDLARNGHMDDALRKLVRYGVPTAWAICCATLNTAECYGLKDKGAIAPAYSADIVLVNNLTDFDPIAVFKQGKLVAEHKKPLFQCNLRYLPKEVGSTVRIKDVTPDSFRMNVASGRARALYVVPDSLVTEEVCVPVKTENGDVVLANTDLTKLAVVERHFATGNIGLALVKGYGLKNAAIGISVAHDSHNLVIMGDDNGKMARVTELLKEAGGGMAVVTDGREEVFPLDIAGLMSSASSEEVIARTAEIGELAKAQGIKEGYEPFMTLAFLSLAVIPKLRLTDRGLFDVETFAFTDTEIK